MESRLRLKTEMWKSSAFLTLLLLCVFICITDISFQSIDLSSHCLLMALFEKNSYFDEVQFFYFILWLVYTMS